MVSPRLGFTQAPSEITGAIQSEAKQIAATNLRAAIESKHILDGFAKAGVDVLFIKGLTLGQLAYGDSAIKAAVDVDILIAPEQLEHAAQLLSNRGYHLRAAGRPDRLQKQHDLRKESAWVCPGQGLAIDLHTRLADNPRLIPAIGLGSPRREVRIADGVALPTLARDEMFAYLAVHGASSAWFRLKWITDLAALLYRSGNDVERLYRRSQELGAGRAAGQALLHSDSLYETLADVPHLKRELEADRVNRWLAKVALRQVAGSVEPVEPTSVTAGTAAIHYSQLMLLPGFSFKLSELLRQARATLG